MNNTCPWVEKDKDSSALSSVGNPLDSQHNT